VILWTSQGREGISEVTDDLVAVGTVATVVDVSVAVAIDTLHESVEDVLQIVPVLPLSAWHVLHVGRLDARVPSVVVAHNLSDVAIELFEKRVDVVGTTLSVRFGIVTVAVRTAEIAAKLEETGGTSRV